MEHSSKFDHSSKLGGEVLLESKEFIIVKREDRYFVYSWNGCQDVACSYTCFKIFYNFDEAKNYVEFLNR